SWMANITSIQGALHIDNTGLATLSGIGNLKTVTGDFTLTSNASLGNLGTLTGLTDVDGSLSITSNAVLSNVNALSALTSIGSGGKGGNLKINSNGALANLGTGTQGLVKLATVNGFVDIDNNYNLTNLDGLKSLTSVGRTSSDYLYIYNNTL